MDVLRMDWPLVAMEWYDHNHTGEEDQRAPQTDYDTDPGATEVQVV